MNRRAVWVALYLAIVIAPLALLINVPGYGNGWSTFAVTLGFIAYFLLVLQFVMATRSDRVVAPFGADVVLRFHRYAGMALYLIVLAHLAVIFVTQEWARGWFWPLSGPFEAQMGILAFAALTLISVTSVWRPAAMSYEGWRAIHNSAAVVAMVAAYTHALASSPYSSNVPVRWALMGGFILAAISMLQLRVGRARRLLQVPYSIDSTRPEGDAVTTLRLRPLLDRRIHFEPGQFAWLRFGGSALSLKQHPFSFSSSADDTGFIEFSVKNAGDGSAQIVALQPGTPVLIDGPHGAPAPIDTAHGFVFIVGGIGITPALSIIRTLHSRRDHRPITLVHGVRSAREVPFADELASMSRELQLTTHIVVSDDTAGWEGLTGYVDQTVLTQVLPANMDDRYVLVCAPEPMQAAVVDALEQLNVPQRNIRVEGFALA